MEHIFQDHKSSAVDTGMTIQSHWVEAENGPLRPIKGEVFLQYHDLDSGERGSQHLSNLIVRDAGIITAMLFASLSTTATPLGRTLMLALGTGATGPVNSPNAPQSTQRQLNNEIARKAFSRFQFRDGDGNAVSYPTNVLDVTATFNAGEAVGPLNEMMILATASANPAVRNPNNNGPSGYDASIDVSSLDIAVNYLPFGVMNMPSRMVYAITWRLTF